MNHATVTLNRLQTVVGHCVAYDVDHLVSATIPLTVTSTDSTKATAAFDADGRTLVITAHAVGSCFINVDESPGSPNPLSIAVTVQPSPNLSEVVIDHFDPPTP